MKSQTKFLTGDALLWCMAICEGYEPDEWDDSYKTALGTPAQIWRIIEREGILVGTDLEGKAVATNTRFGVNLEASRRFCGTSYAEAAMRCRIALALGDVVDVPASILQDERGVHRTETIFQEPLE